MFQIPLVILFFWLVGAGAAAEDSAKRIWALFAAAVVWLVLSAL